MCWSHGVSQPDPEKAILERLAGPVGQAQFGPPGPGGWRAGFIEGGNWCEADPETVRFVKFRETPRRRLYFVTFEGSIPHLGPELHKLSELYPVERDADGNWTAGGCAGGDDDEEMSRPTPWVNLAGGGWRQLGAELVRASPGQFYAGGRVHGAGIEVARVSCASPTAWCSKTTPTRPSFYSSPTKRSGFRPSPSCSTAQASRSHRIPSPGCRYVGARVRLGSVNDTLGGSDGATQTGWRCSSIAVRGESGARSSPS
jgi:hypothetical protein